MIRGASLMAALGLAAAAGSTPQLSPLSAAFDAQFAQRLRNPAAGPWGSSARRGKRKPGAKAKQRAKDKAARIARRGARRG